MAESSKKTRGKQVIEIKRIEDENDRMITFSKRKSGIYKKASELGILTGAQVGVVIFSPAGKLYSFGHPSIEFVSNRFLGMKPLDATQLFGEAQRQLRIAKLKQYHNDLLSQLDVEKERGKQIIKKTKENNTQGWWEAPINDLNLEELYQMDRNFEDLSKTLHKTLNQLNLRGGGASSSSFTQVNIPQKGSHFPHDNPKS